LGLGEDGHTASLFPGSEAFQERRRIVTEVFGGTPALFRVTLTLPAINQAGTTLVLVAGENKASILREVLEGAEARYPAQYVRPASGRLFWLADAGAASHIRKVETK
jgi:6-phosphogluconolactonase